MKFLFPFLFVLLAVTPAAFSAEPATNAPPAAPAAPAPAKEKSKKAAPQAKANPAEAKNKQPASATNAAPVAAPMPEAASPSGPLKFDDYLKELSDTLKLTDDEKKSIQSYYLADGEMLKNVLNNDTLSPLQQAQQVSDARDVRNAKIGALIGNDDRRRAFFGVEARYRVALTELAADGGLLPAPPVPASAPVPTTVAPAPAPAASAPVEKASADKSAAK